MHHSTGSSTVSAVAVHSLAAPPAAAVHSLAAAAPAAQPPDAPPLAPSLASAEAAGQVWLTSPCQQSLYCYPYQLPWPTRQASACAFQLAWCLPPHPPASPPSFPAHLQLLLGSECHCECVWVRRIVVSCWSYRGPLPSSSPLSLQKRRMGAVCLWAGLACERAATAGTPAC